MSRLAPRRFHRIEADLEDGWLSEWASAGIAELEDYLARQAAFAAYLQGEKPGAAALAPEP